MSSDGRPDYGARLIHYRNARTRVSVLDLPWFTVWSSAMVAASPRQVPAQGTEVSLRCACRRLGSRFEFRLLQASSSGLGASGNLKGRDVMKVLVIGAAGRTGRAVVEKAVAAGHVVKAFVRKAEEYRSGCPRHHR